MGEICEVEQMTLPFLVEKINEEHQLTLDSIDDALEHGINTGRYLILARKQVLGDSLRGEWTEWIAKNCKFSHRTANAYVRLADNSQRVASYGASSMRQALELLVEPEPEPEPLRVVDFAESEPEIETESSYGMRDPLPGQRTFLDDPQEEQEECRPEPKSEIDQFGEEFLKQWDQFRTFLVSVPRRGGIVELTSRWSRSRREQTVTFFRSMSREISGLADILEEELQGGEREEESQAG